MLFGSHVPRSTELKERAKNTIGLDVSIRGTRKICDLKPAYGEIFGEYIKPYDFWGYCDIDVVWGDLDKITNDKILDRYEVISIRGDKFISGAFSLFENNRLLKKLYKKSPSLEEVYSDYEMLSFSEAGNRSNYKKDIGNISKIKKDGNIVSITDMVFNRVGKGDIAFYTPKEPYIIRELKTQSKFKFSINYDEGRLYEEDWGEIPALHFLFAKKDPFFIIPSSSKVPSRFSINNRGVKYPHTMNAKFNLKRLIFGPVRWLIKNTKNKAKNILNKIL